MALKEQKPDTFDDIFPPHQQYARSLLDEHLRRQLAAPTYASYKQYSKSLRLIGADGSTPVDKIFTPQNLKRLMALQADKGHSLRQKTFFMFKRVASFLADLGMIDSATGDAIALMRFKSKNKPKRAYLEPEGIETVLLAILHKGHYTPLERLTLGTVFTTLLLTGVRSNELCGLEIADVDFEKGMIRVQKAKGGRPRVIGLPRRLEPVLRLYLRHRPDSSSPTFFVNQSGTPMNRDLIAKRFTRLSKLSGVHVTAHCMRRTMATLTARKNVPIDAIQAVLGHQDVSMTRAYIQTNAGAVAIQMRDW